MFLYILIDRLEEEGRGEGIYEYILIIHDVES